MSATAEIAMSEIAEPGEVKAPELTKVTDANDYSRFSELPDSDDEAPIASEGEKEDLTLADAISRANGFKDAGNCAFKRNDYREAGLRYVEGIAILDGYQKKNGLIGFDDLKSLIVSLHGNNAMVLVKLENWHSAVASASAVLKVEKCNLKALFRRGVSYHKSGFLEEARCDLSSLLELESANIPAQKQLTLVMKDIKEAKQKEKAAFSKMFQKNIYGDKEAERISRERKEIIQREKDNDEWIKSKLSRRTEGKEELSFEDWKKDKKDSEEKTEKARKDADEKMQKEKAARIDTERLERNKITRTEINKNDTAEADGDDSDRDIEYDEEDNKILMETKKKGYCYFRNEQTVEVKALIGDITPKALKVTDEDDPTHLEGEGEGEGVSSEEMEKVKGSSWNHAGTWEERDMTDFSKSRITDLCKDLQASTEGAGHSSEMSAAVTDVKSVEGEAQIVLARGKKKFIYDFSVVLHFEVKVRDIENKPDGGLTKDKDTNASKTKKFKGTITLSEVSPGTDAESSITFKNTVTASQDKSVLKASSALRDLVLEKMKLFEIEFKAM